MSLRRPRLIAACAAAFCLLMAPSALGAAHLSVSVDASPDPVAAGQYVVYGISVTNTGNAHANSVVVKDVLPPRTQWVPNDADCSYDGGSNTATCNAGTINKNGGNRVFEIVLRLNDFSFYGTIDNQITASWSGGSTSTTEPVHVLNNSHDHHITVTKAEKQWDFERGSGIRTIHLDCPNPGDIMLDGSVRVDNTDQDTGTLRSLLILDQYADGDGYTFTAVNEASGRIQAKVFGTCISKFTQEANADGGGASHKHKVIVESPKTVTIHPAAAGHQNVKVACDVGDTFVAAAAPGFHMNGAEGELTYSMPGYDAAGKPAWDFGMDVTQGGEITFSIRCLERRVSQVLHHDHELWISHPTKVFTVQPNAPAAGQYDIDCSDEAKGYVVGYDLPYGVHMVGNDPQPKRRSLKLLNDSGSPKQVRVTLLCIGDRTGTDPPVAPSSVAGTSNVSGSGASVAVGVSCPAGGCGGTVQLVTGASGTRAVSAATRVIGSATFKTASKGRALVRVAISKRYRGAIRSGRIRKVTAVFRQIDGKVVKRQTIRLKRR